VSRPLLSGAFEAFRDHPSSPAVIETGRTWVWSELEDELEAVARELETDPDPDPVRILRPSDSSFLIAFLAAAAAGRAASTLHQDWSRPELEAAIDQISGFEANPAVREEDPIFYIGFTSGTSGRPKPFARRQRSWSSSFDPAGKLFGVETGDRVFLPGSLQHSHFLFGAVFALNRGAAVRLFESFDADLLARELAATDRGVVYLVPTMLLDLDGSGTECFEGVHSVVVSGAKMEAHHWEIARRIFPHALVGELYGASELSFVSVNTGGEAAADPGYVGQPFPGVEIEIRPSGDAGDDETGLVYVRSPYLFDGYIEGSSMSSPVGPDGFMTVGDVGRLTGRGLSLVGRASNMLITGGKNVHPEEVEAQLGRHPGVDECVVIGLPHPRWGEELVAFLTAADDADGLSAEPLRAYLKERVASYKVPKRWFLVDEIPRTRAQKTDRSPERLFDGATEIV